MSAYVISSSNCVDKGFDFSAYKTFLLNWSETIRSINFNISIRIYVIVWLRVFYNIIKLIDWLDLWLTQDQKKSFRPIVIQFMVLNGWELVLGITNTCVFCCECSFLLNSGIPFSITDSQALIGYLYVQEVKLILIMLMNYTWFFTYHTKLFLHKSKYFVVSAFKLIIYWERWAYSFSHMIDFSWENCTYWNYLTLI